MSGEAGGGSDHGHGQGHGHGHGHANDQGLKAVVRYLRHGRSMWSSEINRAVMARLAPQPAERVVDVGAGMGAGSMVLAAHGASVLAVEPTPFLRRVLRGRRALGLGRGRARRVEVVDGGAENLPAADGSVDAVVAVNTMHHWVDPDRAAAEIARVLRPGGRVLLVDEDFEDPTHPEYEQFGRHAEDDDHHGFSMVDASEMGDRLAAAGLERVEAGAEVLDGRPCLVVEARAASGS